LSTVGPATIVKFCLSLAFPEPTTLFAVEISVPGVTSFVSNNLELVQNIEFLVGFMIAGAVSLIVDLRTLLSVGNIYQLEDESGLFKLPARKAETPWDLIGLICGSAVICIAELAKYLVVQGYDEFNVYVPVAVACVAGMMIWRRKILEGKTDLPEILRKRRD
jgi:hypothetical protein